MVTNYNRPPPPEEDVEDVKTLRLEIPVSPPDRQLMREIADILKGMGTWLDFHSRLTDRSDREMQLNIVDCIRQANNKIRREAGLRGIRWRTGRPTNKEMKALGMPVPETKETKPINLTQYIDEQRRRS